MLFATRKKTLHRYVMIWIAKSLFLLFGIAFLLLVFIIADIYGFVDFFHKETISSGHIREVHVYDSSKGEHPRSIKDKQKVRERE